MTLFVPNLLARFVGPNGLIQKPWNNFFSQFSSPPSKAITIDVGASPFEYQAGEPGTIVIINGTVSNVSLIRGTDTIDYGTAKNLILMIKDTAAITYSVLPTVKFLPFYGAPR